MITWMQHHKKYLIVTIWVSVIAFVGAGFVGWGSLDLSNRSTMVAKVGKHEVTIQNYQNAYSNYFNYLNELNNGQLTQDDAEKAYGLRNLVLNVLINEALLFNFADEMGLVALESDVAAELKLNPNFYNERGVFDKDIYYAILKNNGIKTADYEEILKRQALLKKVNALFNLPISDKDRESVGSAFFLEDRITLGTVTVDDSEVVVTDNDTHSYWEINKNMFLTQKSYEFGSVFVPASTKELLTEDIKKHYEETKYFYKDSEEKIAEFEAVKEKIENDLRVSLAESDSKKTFLSLKKNEIEVEKNITIEESNQDYNVAQFQTIAIGEVIAPIKRDNGYEVLKLTKINFPEPKAYEDARPQILLLLKEQKRAQLLTQKAEARVSLFGGEDIGFIDRTNTEIKNLSNIESNKLVGQIFSSTDKVGYIVLSDKALLYRITDQKLPSEDTIKNNSELLDQNVKQIITKEINDNIIKQLRARYKIEQYI